MRTLAGFNQPSIETRFESVGDTVAQLWRDYFQRYGRDGVIRPSAPAAPGYRVSGLRDPLSCRLCGHALKQLAAAGLSSRPGESGGRGAAFTKPGLAQMPVAL